MNVIGHSRVLPSLEPLKQTIPAAEKGRPTVKKQNRKFGERRIFERLGCPVFLGPAFVRFLLLTLFLSLSPTGVINQVPAKTPDGPASSSIAEADLVHFGDVVDVDVLGSLDFDWRGTLTPEGYLNGLDKIEEQVYALCRSESAIATDIAKYYGKFLRDPKIVVRIVDRGNRAPAVVDGAVRKPQRYQIRRPVFLNELIILSGGITDRSNGEIAIYRPKSLNCLEQTANPNSETFVNARQGNDSQNIAIRISDLLKARDGSNPPILSGDIVTVLQASPIFVIGGVNNPHQISSREEITLSRAIATAGGLSKDAVESQITIFRRDGGQSRTIAADLGKIRAGKDEDPVLKPFDIVDVGQKGRAKAKMPPVFAAENERERLLNLPVRVVD